MSFTNFQGYKIWYRVTKPAISDSNTPVLLLHGGPGLGSDYLEPLERMADQGRTVIRFDQLGCGRSDRPRDLSLWDIDGCNGLGIRGQTFILDNADRFSKDLNIINGRNTVTGEEGTDSSDGCFPSGALEEAENHQARSPGSVLVSEGTHRLARKFFAFVHLNLCGSRGNRSRLRPGGSSGRRRSTRGSRRP